MSAPAGESNHLKRDARDAAFHGISVELGKYRRRLTEDAYREVDNLLAVAEGEVDGTAVGAQAARLALSPYLGISGPSKAIDAAEGDSLDA